MRHLISCGNADDTRCGEQEISYRAATLVGLAVLLGYTAWIGAPYFRSVVVRDAAVTTWINATASPIDGFVGDKPLHCRR